MTARTRNWLAALGLLIIGASLVFVGLRVAQIAPSIGAVSLQPQQFGTLAALAVGLAWALTLMALAWDNLLDRFSAPVPRAWAIRTYGISQLAKYIPGNVFQYAGRQAMGMAAGLPARSLAASLGAEIAIQLVAGACFLPLLAPSLLPAIAPSLMLVALLLLIALVVGVAFRLFGPSLGRAVALHLLFHVCAASTFVATAFVIWPDVSSPLLLAGAYIAAWLAGFATPGAPSGLGVREAVLLFLLQGLAGDAMILTLVLLHRLVTVAADLLLFAAASLVPATAIRTVP